MAASKMVAGSAGEEKCAYQEEVYHVA